MTVAMMTPAELSAQAAGTPLGAPFNATVPGRLLPTIGADVGGLHTSAGGASVLGFRGALDYSSLTITASYAHLGGNNASGNSVGAGIAIDLWQPRRSSYFAQGGRLMTAIEYTSLDNGDDRFDVPVALVLGHRIPPLTFSAFPWIAPRIQARLDDGDVTWLPGISTGIDIVKTRCSTSSGCVYGWGIRLAGEVLSAGSHRPVELAASVGLMWKFF